MFYSKWLIVVILVLLAVAGYAQETHAQGSSFVETKAQASATAKARAAARAQAKATAYANAYSRAYARARTEAEAKVQRLEEQEQHYMDVIGPEGKMKFDNVRYVLPLKPTISTFRLPISAQTDTHRYALCLFLIFSGVRRPSCSARAATRKVQQCSRVLSRFTTLLSRSPSRMYVPFLLLTSLHHFVLLNSMHIISPPCLFLIVFALSAPPIDSSTLIRPRAVRERGRAGHRDPAA